MTETAMPSADVDPDVLTIYHALVAIKQRLMSRYCSGEERRRLAHQLVGAEEHIAAARALAAVDAPLQEAE